MVNSNNFSLAFGRNNNCSRCKFSCSSIHLLYFLSMKFILDSVYKTTLTIVLGLAILSKSFDIPVLLSIALWMGVLTLFSRKLAVIIATQWHRLGAMLGYIMPNVLLTVIYYLLLTPLAVMKRIFEKADPLCLKNKNSVSNFRIVNRTIDKECFTKMW